MFAPYLLYSNLKVSENSCITFDSSTISLFFSVTVLSSPNSQIVLAIFLSIAEFALAKV